MAVHVTTSDPCDQLPRAHPFMGYSEHGIWDVGGITIEAFLQIFFFKNLPQVCFLKSYTQTHTNYLKVFDSQLFSKSLYPYLEYKVLE